ncbi:MAG: hypothetical protein K2Z76_00515, partial [Mycobacterium gordonae]|nr:hypothetical protein [Mycobacterium gordonae]
MPHEKLTEIVFLSFQGLRRTALARSLLDPSVAALPLRRACGGFMWPFSAQMLRRFYEDDVTKNQGECWLNSKIRVHSARLATLNRPGRGQY